ncbi:Pimeloyl-ACP methyl ester carboxylesterase [Evansella caseinilytica]|uniref:Pimeloyl-ACP methyl ester carboxylesterase n=1 Tax=Evansella caseinilytica TaxID=1503961 RepID=A0A1H3T3Q2_9BACI|nr:alpha/beta hydrolase [Evansella caseinilytica]SDZ44670.1 Pimeloyl-ACP methyl ester carboxylesterase [Evansella caseinilytica]
MPYTKSDARPRIYYEIEGNGPALVFIHPPGMGHVTFRGQKEGLKPHFTVIMVDLRGNGRSETGDEPLTMPVIAEDIVHVLNDCNVEQAYVCGYSNGGSIVQEMAISFPDRVKGIILIGAFPEVNSFLLKNEFRLGIWATDKKLMNLIANVLAIAHEKETEERKELSAYVKKTSPVVLEKYYQIGLDYQATQRLEKIKCPVLLVYGQHDDYVHHYRHLFQKYVSWPVSAILVGNVAHQIPTKKVAAFNQIVKTFVKDNEKQPSPV